MRGDALVSVLLVIFRETEWKEETMNTNLDIVLSKVNEARNRVATLVREIRSLRLDTRRTTGETEEHYKAVINDKLREIEHIVVLLPHTVLANIIH